MDQCSTGTTSHQHYRPPHQPPGHDLVIDLKQARQNKCSPAAGSGNRMPQRGAAAVPLGQTVSRLGESNPGPTHYEIYPAVDGCLRLLRIPLANKGTIVPKPDGC